MSNSLKAVVIGFWILFLGALFVGSFYSETAKLFFWVVGGIVAYAVIGQMWRDHCLAVWIQENQDAYDRAERIRERWERRR